LQIDCKSADQRLIGAFAQTAGRADKSCKKIGLEPSGRCLAQYVKAVANLGFLEVAEPCIQFLKSAVTLLITKASVEIDVRCTSGVEDSASKGKKAPAVDTGCKVIFVDQALEIAQRSV
jgi:hypothetical protein